MRISPDSVSGRRLRRYGVSSAALRGTVVLPLGWSPVGCFTLPVPFDGAVILLRKKLLDRELDGELADSPALAPLVHQFCHAHQRLEWGVLPYLWRHVMANMMPRGTPSRHREVERECCSAAQSVIDAHALPAAREEQKASMQVE